MRIFPAIFIILVSCSGNGNSSGRGKVTSNEDKGIKDIIGAYGGTCEYGFGTNASSEKGLTHSFWLTLSKCQMLDTYDKYQKNPSLPISNMAYLMYRNLDSEKNEYSEIHPKVVFSNGTSVDASYKFEELEIVKRRMPVVLHIVDLLKVHNYDSIKTMMSSDTSVFIVHKEELLQKLSAADSSFGDITGFQTEGFVFRSYKNGKRFLHISGSILRDKTSNCFSVDIDLDSPIDEFSYMNYQF